jgi:hypothetical protein
LAERRRGQAVLVPQVRDRVVRPAEAHRDRLGDLIASDDNLVALDLGLRGVEDLVLAGDGEAGEGLALALQTLPDVRESEDGLVAVHLHLVEQRAAVLDLLAVGDRAGGQRQPRSDGFLALGVDVLLVADVGDDGHRGVRHLERHQLRLTQPRPVGVGRVLLNLHERGELHEQEREVALAPVVAPVLDHQREGGLVELGAAGV